MRVSSSILRAVMRFIAVALVAVAQSAFGQAGVLYDVSGPATIELPDGTTSEATVGAPLVVGAVLVLGPSSEMTVKMQDGQVMKLSPGTRLSITNYQFIPGNLSASVAQIRIAEGSARVVGGAIGVGNPAGVRVEVAGTVVQMQSPGADFVVSSANGVPGVSVQSGTVATPNGSSIQTGQFSILAGQAVGQPVPIDAAPAVFQAGAAALRSGALPDSSPISIASESRALVAAQTARAANAAAAANPGNTALQQAALAASQLASNAEQAARTDATVLASTVFAGVIAALPQTGAGVETPNLPLGTPLAAASPSVTSCVGSPC